MEKRAQVWVETVIYTLIGLVIIGLLLAFVKPAIDEKRDQIVLQQSLEMMNSINGEIENAIYYGKGNSIPVEISIKKGELVIKPSEGEIEFKMRSKYKYSQPGKNVNIGKVIARTNEATTDYDVSFKIKYDSASITFNNEAQDKILQQAPTPYKVYITNNGEEEDKIKIDISMS